MTSTTTIYLVATTKLALACFHKRDAAHVPMLNDNLGDRCHHTLEDAVAAGLDIAETLDEKSADITIVHVSYPTALHEELARDGHINGVTERDFFGKPLWKLTPAGALRLNHEARFLMDVYNLPPEIRVKTTTSSTAIN